MSNAIIEVLLVEDDEDDYIITHDIFSEIEGTKFIIDWVRSYNAALEMMAQRQHDVYLFDYRLGEYTGLELLEQVRANGCQSPIIFLTGQSDHEVDIKAMEAGASDYLVKSQLTATLLERSIRYAIERTRKLEILQQRDEQIQRLAAIVESSADAIIGLTLDNTIINWNQSAERIFGYQANEVIGQSINILITKQIAYQFTELLDQHKQGLHIDNYEVICLTKAGKDIDLSLTISPIKGLSQEIIGTSIIARDITYTKRVEKALLKSEEKYRLLFEASPEAMWVYDIETLKFLAVNDAAIARYGYHYEEFLNMTICDIRPKEDVDRVLESVKNLQTSPMFSSNWRHYKKDGSLIWVDIASHTIQFNDRDARLVLAIDVTERKRAQEALIEERLMLTCRVEERTADLSLANAQLARAGQMKDEFLASMSHELRTPLNSIIGLSEALQEGVYGILNERQSTTLHIIEDSGYHLLSLINDILDLSKIEAGKFELTPDWIEVESLCQSSLAFVKQSATKKHLKISFIIDSQLDKIWADDRRLKQILVNLLSNAVKFTALGGTIGLEVTADAETQTAKFIIWDTGIGIAPEDLGRIFQPFVQVDSALSRQQSGTGLGLALISRMIDMHGGSISVESELYKGSRFTVSLPWQQEKLSTTNELFGENHSSLPNVIKRVLIVEDSSTTAEQLVRYLKDLQIETVVHFSENGVFEVVNRLRPELIFLDILLPEPVGWQILEQLKADITTNNIPVIIISVIDEKRRGLELGAADYLVKPITREQLQVVINKISPSTLLMVDSNMRLLPGNEKLAKDHSVNAKQRLILLAEDNESNIRTFSEYLEISGYKAIIARNGTEAITRARENSPDLILMDIQMPGMDGLEATRCIRADVELADIPIIALTALAMPGDRNRCLQAGVNEYLSKPVNLKGLITAIEVQLNRSQHAGSNAG